MPTLIGGLVGSVIGIAKELKRKEFHLLALYFPTVQDAPFLTTSVKEKIQSANGFVAKCHSMIIANIVSSLALRIRFRRREFRVLQSSI